MAIVLESNKTKIARRVIEVFEFFDHQKEATVTDIVRRYGRPQSSTSELLASLVEMGLLYKNRQTRTYSPTPRLATLGSAVQPDIIRDGHLFAFMDRLAKSTRFGIGLFGMVNVHVQLFRWVADFERFPVELASGSSERLHESVVGQLLLSTMTAIESGKILRRLNAEADEQSHFNYGSMVERVAEIRNDGYVSGQSGFGCTCQVTAVMLPAHATERPLALGMIYPENAHVDAQAMVSTLRNGIDECLAAKGAPVTAPHAIMRGV